VEADEVRQRSAQEEKKGRQLLAHEMTKIPQRLDRLVEEATLTKEEAGEFIIQPRLHDVHIQSPAGYIPRDRGIAPHHEYAITQFFSGR